MSDGEQMNGKALKFRQLAEKQVSLVLHTVKKIDNLCAQLSVWPTNWQNVQSNAR